MDNTPRLNLWPDKMQHAMLYEPAVRSCTLEVDAEVLFKKVKSLSMKKKYTDNVPHFS